MVTVKEVAKHAGVSLATVSRVMNGASNVSPSIKEKVINSVNELGYFPNNAARSLVNRQAGSIAVLLRNLHSPFFTELIRGMEEAAFSVNRNVFFCSLGKEQEYRDQYIRFLTNGISDAIILYGSLFSDKQIIEHLCSLKFPLLLIENNFQSLPVNQFLVNNFDGSKKGVEYLIGLGHRRIAHFMGDANKQINLERFNGYTQAMQENGLQIHTKDIYHISNDYELAYQMAQEIMEQPPEERPTAIFCSSDRIASRAIMGVLDKGYRIPEDISILGYDNQLFHDQNYSGPKITTIKQPLYEIGRDSILAVTKLLDEKPKQRISKIYETELVKGGTVCEKPETGE
ncbi:MAG: LacI family DNA-binding transcriptional regulator [Lacrimispora sp.]